MAKFNFKKKFGQNFLQNKMVISNIVGAISPSENDLIVEIGPGAGALTKELVTYGCNVLCYEIDTEVSQYLDNIKCDKLRVIYDDFMNRDVVSDLKEYQYENLFIMGNLPYYITTPIILKIINLNLGVKDAVFMVQKEVADRFSAEPKTRDYGSISVFLNYYFNIKKLFVVGKKNFVPVPNVDSAVIKLSAKEDRLDVDVDKFNKLVKNSFQFKRKNLRNNLSAYDKEKINYILEENGYSLDNRAEDLPYEVFVEIANKY